MQQMIAGVKRFQTEVFPHKKELFEWLASGQRPSVMFIRCADSRVHPRMITPSDPGDSFISRNAGNLENHPCVAGALSSAKLQLNGWNYEIATGQFPAHERSPRRLVPLVQEAEVTV